MSHVYFFAFSLSSCFTLAALNDINCFDHEEGDVETTLERTVSEVCYPDIDCFRLEPPWYVKNIRPIELLPQSPDIINTKFYLSTRNEYGLNRRVLRLRPEIQCNWSDFRPNRWTVFITHGFNSHAGTEWIRKLEGAILLRSDANIISVDWSEGARGINYMQTTANTRVVAAEISRLIRYFIREQRLCPDRIHLMGQSLGAHIMSYVANNVSGIARITGLDPAQPGFEGYDPAVYLDASDANFVDIIHTNGDPFIPRVGFGFITPCGHVDFYVNGGTTQPGCPGVSPKGPLAMIFKKLTDLLMTPIELLVNYAACSHSRAYEYFIEAIVSNCSFWGHEWDPSMPVPDLKDCTPGTCSEMGRYTDLFPARGSFYVKTYPHRPFCVAMPEVERRMKRYVEENNLPSFYDGYVGRFVYQ